jgi:beta-galactosidase
MKLKLIFFLLLCCFANLSDATGCPLAMVLAEQKAICIQLNKPKNGKGPASAVSASPIRPNLDLHKSVGQSRKEISLNSNWLTIADENSNQTYNGFQLENYKLTNWKNVNVPHNWDQYEGYQRKLHGNKHGYAWYRKTFRIGAQGERKKYFLYFEGVGSYATVWLNGTKVGYHAGGRTTFTLDVSKAIHLNNKLNLLAVRADHPANIQDLPWVDGGCSTERGFSEGSQPMGIFRPVHLMVTNDIRIEPFGVHVWNDNRISTKAASLNLAITLKNYSSMPQNITVINQLLDQKGKLVKEVKTEEKVIAGKEVAVKQVMEELRNPNLWSLTTPYLYTVKTILMAKGKVIDELKTPYGIRSISWPIGEAKQKQFLLNGKPVFINGIAEYEHLIGNSHAFTNEQIRSRVMQIKAAGFNSFRDAHQPHNLLYQTYWDQLGILSWTQMAAHIWYDTPEFRKNFKTLLTDWVKERRNSPSVVLWGLENESTLPEDFAKECTELIRKLDPTASSQRKVTTCNGGKGTDWDVPQNWTGTYGGNPLTYAEDLKRQVLVGEYGAWRTIDLHELDSATKGYTENQMTAMMETKVRLAESVKGQVAGHYFWLYSSHDNPGRVQGGEGLRDLDRIGPVNYKGMFTPWEEPTDAFYMFRSNYAPKETEPMVYIVSHTWPNRWTKPGIKDSIVVYSNCDEVELFNDIDGKSLGKKTRSGIGTHFQWDKVDIRYNVLYAVGYVNGKRAAKDEVILIHLPEAPNLSKLQQNTAIAQAVEGYHYLYRLNCGGPAYTDHYGKVWMADQQWTNQSSYGSSSWAAKFSGIPSFFASQRRTFSPIQGTSDWKLFQSFRYGREELNFKFLVPKDGEYMVELYFIEPWLGIGGGFNAEQMRLFDVAVNGNTVIKDLDIWREAGSNKLLKKTVKVLVTGGQLTVSFPQIKVGQAVISAIAIASMDGKLQVNPQKNSIINMKSANKGNLKTWMDIGDQQFIGQTAEFSSLPPNLYGAEWIQMSGNTDGALAFSLNSRADVFVAVKDTAVLSGNWLAGFEHTQTYILNHRQERFAVYRKRFEQYDVVNLVVGGSSYTVAVLPPSQLAPAYDLKTVTSYKATAATFTGQHILKEEFLGKERVNLKTASTDQLTFNISVGVADTYSLTLKYHNPHTKDLKGKMEFFAGDGTLMRTEEIVFSQTKTGKWNYLTTSTGTMVNAGHYKVSISLLDGNGLYIDQLDVQ